MFPWGQPRPHPKGQGPSILNILGPPIPAKRISTYASRYETANKFCMVIKLDDRKFLRGRLRPTVAQNCVKGMLTRDLFAVANLVYI